MISPLYSFTTRTLMVYALVLAVIAGLYGAFTSRPSQMAGLAAQPFSTTLPNLTEVDTTEAAAKIEASGIGRVIDPNAPQAGDSSLNADGTLALEDSIPRVSAVIVENDEAFAFVRMEDGFLKMAVGDSVRLYELIALSPSKAEFQDSDGEVFIQAFFSAAD